MGADAAPPHIEGFRFAGLHCGIKRSGAPDLAVIVADGPVTAAGVFTRNALVAAPVVQSRARLARARRARAVVINSGNANACTGARGAADAEAMARLAANALGAGEDDILVCSTGVIGAPLPMPALERGIPAALLAARPDGLADFAEAIRTTDTRAKLRHAHVAGLTVAGAAKGAGMIHPDMATMLAFVMTDAAVDADALDALWREVCDRSFNAISIDGDTSTNDTALVLASGAAGTVAPDVLRALLLEVAGALARDIVADAEGGTKVVELVVRGARSDDDARRAAHAVATSPLVKTALHGEDPNWGRILAAVGRSGAAFEPDRATLSIGGVAIYRAGEWLGTGAESSAHAVMRASAYAIEVDLGLGAGARTLWTCDFGLDYVRINADYRS